MGFLIKTATGAGGSMSAAVLYFPGLIFVVFPFVGLIGNAAPVQPVTLFDRKDSPFDKFTFSVPS